MLKTDLYSAIKSEDSEAAAQDCRVSSPAKDRRSANCATQPAAGVWWWEGHGAVISTAVWTLRLGKKTHILNGVGVPVRRDAFIITNG